MVTESESGDTGNKYGKKSRARGEEVKARIRIGAEKNQGPPLGNQSSCGGTLGWVGLEEEKSGERGGGGGSGGGVPVPLPMPVQVQGVDNLGRGPERQGNEDKTELGRGHGQVAWTLTATLGLGCGSRAPACPGLYLLSLYLLVFAVPWSWPSPGAPEPWTLQSA